jgi:DNA-binding GntR family transcriptional regulator
LTVPVALSETEPLDRKTLANLAYERLSDLLVSGRLAPGDKVSLRSTAEILGTSMMPIREAVTRLVADAALEVTPNRAVRVPVMSASRFRDLTRVRMAVEGLAAAEAALHAGPDAIDAISRTEARFREESARRTPNLSRAVALNRDFHFAVYAAAGSPVLLDIIRALWLKAGPVINLDLRENPDRLKNGGAVGFHAALLGAIRARDPETAKGALTGDVGGAAEFILSRSTLRD